MRTAPRLADVVRDLPEDDERLLMLVTLAVSRGEFASGPAADRALIRFAGTSREVWNTFLTTLVQLRATMPSGGRVITESSLPSARDGHDIELSPPSLPGGIIEHAAKDKR